MGVRQSPDSGLAQALFSRVQQRVLGILFSHPERSFHSSEIIKLANSGSGAVQRELQRLTAAEIVTVSRSGNRKQYRANSASPIFRELHGIVRKTVGLMEPIAHALRNYRSKIEAAFVYGSVAKGKDRSDSDIDLMVIAKDLSYSDIYPPLQKAEKKLLRPVNPTVLTLSEWSKKLAQDNPFLRKVVQQPKLFIIGSQDDLKRTE